MSTDFYKSAIDKYKSLSDKYVQLSTDYNKVLDDYNKVLDELSDFVDLASITIEKYTPGPLVMRVLLQKRLSEIRPLLLSPEDIAKWKRLNSLVDDSGYLLKEDYMNIKKDIDETFDFLNIYDYDSEGYTESDEEYLSETL